MAGDTQETWSSEPQQLETWDARQYEAALAHLERLQDQLDNLRSTIPSTVQPLIRRPAGNAQLFAEVRKSTEQSHENVKAFREHWTSEQTQQLFARCKQSFEQDGDLTKSLDVARWGWASD